MLRVSSFNIVDRLYLCDEHYMIWRLFDQDYKSIVSGLPNARRFKHLCQWTSTMYIVPSCRPLDMSWNDVKEYNLNVVSETVSFPWSVRLDGYLIFGFTDANDALMFKMRV